MLFVYLGASKLTSKDTYWMNLFAKIGVGQWFRYFTGGLELVCAVSLLIPSAFVIASLFVSLHDVGRGCHTSSGSPRRLRLCLPGFPSPDSGRHCVATFARRALKEHREKFMFRGLLEVHETH